MKKTLLFFICAAMLLSVSACAGAPENIPETVSDGTEATIEVPITTAPIVTETTTAEQPVSPYALNSDDYVLNLDHFPSYEYAGVIDKISGSGEPRTYEEIQDFIKYDKSIVFVGYTITRQYTPEEAVTITGEDFFKDRTTLYEAHIYYDYLNDTPVDMTVNIAKTGIPEKQIEYDPLYTVGQRLISPISGINSSWCAATPELVYYVFDVNGIDLAYHLGNENVVLQGEGFFNLNMKLHNDERFVVTSTADNYAMFTQKSTVEDLAEFFRRDWKARGYEFYDFSGEPPQASRVITNE